MVKQWHILNDDVSSLANYEEIYKKLLSAKSVKSKSSQNNTAKSDGGYSESEDD